ncbi:hypothetical protein [Flavobacterium psychrotrophum]|uniref:hypothetical protein n=1 Tax=Flavobacterium psychrotrophum TaxID=2294119 RepID=UPI000E30CA8C|nr:hypothetical protein [Flavobacterium psychrotrophum]
MDELDKLKSHWKKNEETFPKVSEGEIYAMLHKKSSSIVKWILIISIIELMFWSVFTVSGSVVGTTEYKLPEILTMLDYVNYAVLITFIMLFYINYRKISSEKPVKELLQNIITTRRIVRVYMIYVVSVMSLALAFAVFISKKEYNDSPDSVAIMATSIVIVLLIIGFVILLYNVLYGRLLRKLSKNYNELKKMKDA